jgi:hypothetical protein
MYRGQHTESAFPHVVQKHAYLNDFAFRSPSTIISMTSIDLSLPEAGLRLRIEVLAGAGGQDSLFTSQHRRYPSWCHCTSAYSIAGATNTLHQAIVSATLHALQFKRWIVGEVVRRSERMSESRRPRRFS